MHHFEGTADVCGHCGCGPYNPVHHSQNGEEDYRLRLLAEKDARIASLASEVERLTRLLAEKREYIEIYKAMTLCFEEIRARDAILIGNDIS